MRLFVYFICALLSLSCCAQTQVIAHMTRLDGGFQTNLIVENPTSEEIVLEVTPYHESGTKLPSVLELIPATSVQYLTREAFIGDDIGASAGYLIIGTEQYPSEGLIVSAVYKAIGENGSTARAKATTLATNWRIFPGNWQEVFDGISLVNLGDEAASVTVTQYAADGTLIESKVISEALASMGKTLYLLGGPDLEGFSEVASSYFEIESSQPSAITALRGTLPGSLYLWTTQLTTLSGE